MMEYNNHWYFDLADAIRANRLIRGRVDFPEFTSWYQSLSPVQQGCLVRALCEFAYQAGVGDGVYAEALRTAGLSAEDSVVQQARGLWRGKFSELCWLDDHWTKLAERERFTVFTMVVHLFAVAEGRVLRAETKAYCNHWWHRDLLDDRVVQAILRDPEYYNTSMKDDDRIKDSAV